MDGWMGEPRGNDNNDSDDILGWSDGGGFDFCAGRGGGGGDGEALTVVVARKNGQVGGEVSGE